MIREPTATGFLSTLSLRRATKSHKLAGLKLVFLSTLSLRRATRLGLLGWLRVLISIHALLAESDKSPDTEPAPVPYFYPRSPCGERPPCIGCRPISADFYPRSPCGERRYSLRYSASRRHFYPRSPCGERLRLYRLPLITLPISIHALLAESDRQMLLTKFFPGTFLSTLSLRRATIPYQRQIDQKSNFYPRSPCGERHLRVVDGSKSSIISIHALLAESDGSDRGISSKTAISIHALLAESDGGSGVGSWPRGIFLSTLSLRRATCCSLRHSAQGRHFYPRSPCGERRQLPTPEPPSMIRFLSTLSLRRATANWFDLWGWAEYFYPRSPCGERHVKMRMVRISTNFYPRSPCGERRWGRRVFSNTFTYFYPRSPCGERQLWNAPEMPTQEISIHALLAESDGQT